MELTLISGVEVTSPDEVISCVVDSPDEVISGVVEVSVSLTRWMITGRVVQLLSRWGARVVTDSSSCVAC